MTTTYTKLNTGAWGLRANGSITPGQQVQVTTRDGRVKTETVGQIVWTGNGVTVATTAREERQQPVQPMPVARETAPVVQPAALDKIIADLETALAGLKSLRAAA